MGRIARSRKIWVVSALEPARCQAVSGYGPERWCFSATPGKHFAGRRANPFRLPTSYATTAAAAKSPHAGASGTVKEDHHAEPGRFPAHPRARQPIALLGACNLPYEQLRLRSRISESGKRLLNVSRPITPPNARRLRYCSKPRPRGHDGGPRLCRGGRSERHQHTH